MANRAFSSGNYVIIQIDNGGTLNTFEFVKSQSFYTERLDGYDLQQNGGGAVSIEKAEIPTFLNAETGGVAYTEATLLAFLRTFTGVISEGGGGGGGVQSVTGTLVDTTDPLNPVVNPNPFTEESTIIAGSGSGTWVLRGLGINYANKEIEMQVYASNGNQVANVGVRKVGSAVPKSFPLRIGSCYFQTVADASGNIEILSDNINKTFQVIGTRPLI